MLERYKGEKVTLATGITILRTAGSLYFANRYAKTGNIKHFFLAGVCQAFDGVDGWVARRFNQETALGSDLDKASDKIVGTALVAAALKQKNIEYTVAGAIAAHTASNIAATVYSAAHRNLLEGANEEGRNLQKWMLGGMGFNVFGKHMQKQAQSPEAAFAWGALRFISGAASFTSVINLGIPSTIDYWHKARSIDVPRINTAETLAVDVSN